MPFLITLPIIIIIHLYGKYYYDKIIHSSETTMGLYFAFATILLFFYFTRSSQNFLSKKYEKYIKGISIFISSIFCVRIIYINVNFFL